MALSKKKKVLIVIIFLLLLVGIGVTIWRVNATQWERTFEITYDGYISYLDDAHTISLQNPYKKYTIKNKTNRTRSSVYAVIQVKTWEGKKFEFEKIIHYKLEANETAEFRISESDVKTELERRNLSPYMWGSEIVKVKYK